jgi:hypothetical protein
MEIEVVQVYVSEITGETYLDEVEVWGQFGSRYL